MKNKKLEDKENIKWWKGIIKKQLMVESVFDEIIISHCLSIMRKKFGTIKTNLIIEDLELNKHGFKSFELKLKNKKNHD